MKGVELLCGCAFVLAGTPLAAQTAGVTSAQNGAPILGRKQEATSGDRQFLRQHL